MKSSGGVSRVWHRLVRSALPEDQTFWKVYAPVIRILRDSREHQLIRQKINAYFGLSKSDVVLEEGCGNAIWLSEIIPQVKAAIGLDGEKAMLDAARRRAPGAGFVLADMNERVPFGNGRFTKICSILVDGYLRNREQAVRERYRILSPGGMLAVVTPRKGAKFFRVLVSEAKHRKEEQTVIESLKRLPLAVVAVLFGKIAELKAVIGDWHFYEKDELIDFYRRAGFEIVACDAVYADQAWLLVVRKPN